MSKTQQIQRFCQIYGFFMAVDMDIFEFCSDKERYFFEYNLKPLMFLSGVLKLQQTWRDESVGFYSASSSSNILDL